MLQPYVIRQILSRDDAAMAEIIRMVMPEFGAGGAGFAIHDAEVDWMSRSYTRPRHVYFVVERAGRVLGGGGIGPLEGGDAETCELRKMYFLKELRGIGAGTALMSRCLQAACSVGFNRCDLETLSTMHDAMKLYERSGFVRIPEPMGATGHGGCNTFYLREI